MSGATIQAAANADRFVAAHRALRADADIQFTMAPVTPPPPPPEWLRALGRLLREMLRPIVRGVRWLLRLLPDGPYAQIFLWSVLAVVAVAVGWMAYERIRYGVWRLPGRHRAGAIPVAPADEEAWTPDAAPVRAWLREADAMAAAGRYAEAVHHLLFRSVEDIQKRRPQIVRPALTSRELAAAEGIPGSVRGLFARIAGLVERSLFGGRAVGRDDWTAARAAYADIALPRTWRETAHEGARA